MGSTLDGPVTERSNKADESVTEGAKVGGAVGTAIGAVAAIAVTVALPGIGLVIAGPLAAALAGVGGLTGGVSEALAGAGLPKERAADYERGLAAGGIVLGVRARTEADAEYFEREWQSWGGESLYR
ncbi:MAG TPA: hypothetical protein VNQ79_12040 [Blastocatellia bacterium]|nr:hypothetical protein [Blastocatellia bacterium]